MAPVTLVDPHDEFTEGAERNRAMGAWGAMGGVGGAAGVLLGGILTEFFGWRWILLINLPIGLGIALGAQRCVPPHDRARPRRRHFDFRGA